MSKYKILGKKQYSAKIANLGSRCQYVTMKMDDEPPKGLKSGRKEAKIVYDTERDTFFLSKASALSLLGLK